MSYLSWLLAALAAALILFGLSAVAAGEYMVAGVSLLAASFTIYVRETRT